MTYHVTSRRAPRPAPLSGFWGDVAYGFTQLSNKIVDPIAGLIPGTPAYAAKQVSLAPTTVVTQIKAQEEAARIAAQHGGLATPPPVTNIPGSAFTGDPKKLGGDGSGTGKLLLAGALGVGVFFLWKKTRRGP